MKKNKRIQELLKISQEKEIEPTNVKSDSEAAAFADSIFDQIWSQTIDSELSKLPS